MQAANALLEGRRSAAFNHQKTVADSLHALSWMVYTGPGCGEPYLHALWAYLSMQWQAPASCGNLCPCAILSLFYNLLHLPNGQYEESD